MATTSPGADLDEFVGSVGTRRIDERQPGYQLGTDAVVWPAERLGHLRGVALGFLEGHDVGVRSLDGLDDLVEVDLVAAIFDVEVHELERRRGRRSRGGSGVAGAALGAAADAEGAIVGPVTHD